MSNHFYSVCVVERGWQPCAFPWQMLLDRMACNYRFNHWRDMSSKITVSVCHKWAHTTPVPDQRRGLLASEMKGRHKRNDPLWLFLTTPCQGWCGVHFLLGQVARQQWLEREDKGLTGQLCACKETDRDMFYGRTCICAVDGYRPAFYLNRLCCGKQLAASFTFSIWDTNIPVPPLPTAPSAASTQRDNTPIHSLPHKVRTPPPPGQFSRLRGQGQGLPWRRLCLSGAAATLTQWEICWHLRNKHLPGKHCLRLIITHQEASEKLSFGASQGVLSKTLQGGWLSSSANRLPIRVTHC